MQLILSLTWRCWRQADVHPVLSYVLVSHMHTSRVYVEVKDRGSHTPIAKAAGGKDREYMNTLSEKGEGTRGAGMTGPQEEEEGDQVTADNTKGGWWQQSDGIKH